MNIQKVHLQETVSTNDDAKRLIREGCGSGSLVWADNQTEGRGRLGKAWMSRSGLGLYLSIIYQPKCSREEYAKLTLVVGLAVAEVIEGYVKEPVQLKWPNDIYIGGKKCGGILCEAVLGKGVLEVSDSLVIGIGINIGHSADDFDEEVRVRATSLALGGAENITASQLLEVLHPAVMAKCDAFCAGAWPEIIEAWQERDFLKGRRSQWLTVENRVVEGIAQGVNMDGLLYLVDDGGQCHQVLSGDVQLKL